MEHWPFTNNFETWMEAIQGRDDFKMYDKGDYFVFNYVSIMAEFDDPDAQAISDHERLMRSLRFNMRGTIFSKEKELISLPFHKFMNLNQGNPNSFKNLDWSSYEAYDKLDGSMVRFVKINGKIEPCTKAGITHMSPDIQTFVDKNPEYLRFIQFLGNEYTAIFEYVGNPLHRIIINYPKENLVLLAIRENRTGKYFNYEDLIWFNDKWNIPIVKRWVIEDGQNPEDFIQMITDLKDEEGVVVQFPNGRRVKIKGDDYKLLHRTRSAIETERYVFQCIMSDTIDDIIPLVPEHYRNNLEIYAKGVVKRYNEVLGQYHNELVPALVNANEKYKIDEVGEGMFENSDNLREMNSRAARKEFALNEEVSPIAKRIGFKLFEEWNNIELSGSIEDNLRDMIVKACGSTSKFESEVRKNIFQNDLPIWNIWEGNSIEDELEGEF